MVIDTQWNKYFGIRDTSIFLVYNESSNTDCSVIGYVDSDYASDYLLQVLSLLFYNRDISWNATLQSTVILFTTEV